MPRRGIQRITRAQKKALHCAGPFSYFNATVNIDGASRYFGYLSKSLLRNSTTSLRAASVASAL